MIHKKLLSLLVLLITAVCGAWAEDYTTVFELNGSTASVGNLTLGTSVETGLVKIHGNTDEIAGIKISANYNYEDGKYFTIAPETGSFKKGDKVSIAVCYNNSDVTSSVKADIYADDHVTLLYTTANGINGYTANDDPVVEEYVLTQDASVLYIGGNSYDFTFVTTLKVERLASADPTIDVTWDPATRTASFTMPANDVTATYTIKRDMSVDMPVTVQDAEGNRRFRVQNQGNSFEPVGLTTEQIVALFTVYDDIEKKNLTANTDYTVQLFAADEDGNATGTAIPFNNFTFAPGNYVAKAVAVDGSNYSGETVLSNVFTLFLGYEVEVPAGEYVTYYKNEALYVEDTDAKLYTITAVSGSTATADELTIAPANTPILVKNNGSDTKTIVLIPTTTDTPDNVTAYSGFTGTLEATQIAASTTTQNNYAFNGKEFVRVTEALPVAANKCWLEIPNSANAAPAMTIVFGEVTGIGVIDNGQRTSGDWYDLNGRKLEGRPTKKGVYINNGRKVVIK